MADWFSFVEGAGLVHNGLALLTFTHGDRKVPIIQARMKGDERNHYIAVGDRWFVLTDEGTPVSIRAESKLHADLDDAYSALSIQGLNDTVNAINASRESIEGRFADIFDGAIAGGME